MQNLLQQIFRQELEGVSTGSLPMKPNINCPLIPLPRDEFLIGVIPLKNLLLFFFLMITSLSDCSEFAGHYVDWRNRRVAAIIDYYGEDWFQGKRILEVGCGHAEIGHRFSLLGAYVTVSDARKEHLRVATEKYPHLQCILADSDLDWIFEDHYDLIIHMGLLSHLRDPEHSIFLSTQHCDFLVLESECSDSDDPFYCVSTQERGYDQAFNGIGSRPSPQFVERCLDKCQFHYESIKDDSCNTALHYYNWPVQNTGLWRDGQRRMWFCKGKEVPLLIRKEEKKPTIALFFAGRVKGYEDSCSQFLDFIHKNSIDVFCSINALLDPYHQEFLRVFDVKRHNFEIFEIPQSLEIKNKAAVTNLYNACSMFYNQKKSIELIADFQNETGVNYDLVIYARADMVPSSAFNFKLKVDSFVHIPAGQDHEGINDQMAWGKFSTMKDYCSLFDNIDTYCNRLQCRFHPETLLNFHIQQKNLAVKRFDFSYLLSNKRL